ncbi:MAG TPA: YbaK/EbsC family protein [Ktedonobacteraceae bacterium]|jgi:prolyl-tRNA editing enzyme YbaK/EbsC (Cys-tRNA(Pro) deacylase)|nr:YbaK/EbsC family protein [Ktedonobacteraceae bacterium]
MAKELRASAQRVQDILQSRGFSFQVRELAASTRTAQEAAAAIGCDVAQIAKSLVFKTRVTHRPVLVVASGANRVDESLLAALVGEAIEKPDAAFVRERTGFAVGGVAPIGHTEPLETFIDRDLLEFEAIWAAAGTPYAVFQLNSADLVTLTGGKVVSVKKLEREKTEPYGPPSSS